MSDPAVEAAQRAWAAWRATVSTPRGLAVEPPVVDAAREALNPVRQWLLDHKDDLSIPRLQVAIEDLLPLIYSSDELEGMSR